MPNPLPRLLAYAMPLLLMAGGLWSVTNYADTKEADARENAGQVLNGDKLNVSTVEAIAERIEEQRPVIVVLGDSIANNAVAGRRLAEQLKLSPDEVLMLTIPGSISAHWYALLKHHVFASDHTPALVLVVSSLQSMLDPAPTSTAMRANLDALVQHDDPVLRKKAYANYGSRVVWHRLRAAKQDLRRDLIARARGAWVGLLWGDASAPAGWWRQGQHKAFKAHNRVFASEQLDFSTLNVQATGLPRHNNTIDRLSPPEEGFLPNLARLAAANDTKLMMVRAPLSPLIEPEQADVVPQGWTERARDALERHDARLLDLGDLEVGVQAYRDPLHMTARGKQRFTDVMAHHIAGVRGHVRGTRWWSDRFEPSAAPADEGLSPGHQTTFAFDALWPGEGKRFRVQAKLSGPTQQGEAPPAILLGDQRIRAKRYPNAWVLDGWLPLPQTTPWAMTLEHPGTNESRLDAMTFGDVGHISYVVGDAVRFKGAALDLIRSNPAPYHRVAVTTTPRDHVSDALASAPQNMGVFSAPGFTPIFDQLSLTDHDAATACAPLRILENGKPLGARSTTCARLRHEAPGQSCFDGDRVYFTSSDRRPPANNGNRYEATLHPERSCGEAWWVYPGDTLTFTVPKDAAKDWVGPPRRLAISTLSTAAEGMLQVEVTSASGEHLEARVEPSGETVRAGFVRRLTSLVEEEELRITIRNPSSERYFLVDHLALRS